MLLAHRWCIQAPECPSAHEQRCDARCMERVRSARRCCDLLQCSIVLAAAAALQRMLLSAQSWHKPHETPERGGSSTCSRTGCQQSIPVAAAKQCGKCSACCRSGAQTCCYHMVGRHDALAAATAQRQLARGQWEPAQQHWQQLQRRGAQPAYLGSQPFRTAAGCCCNISHQVAWVVLAMHARMGQRLGMSRACMNSTFLDCRVSEQIA